MRPMDYADLKALAAQLARPVGTLYALAAGNDPFFIGPARTAAAQWFAEQWLRLNIPPGWHYRRIHYVFVSQDGKTAVLMLDGNPYQNTLASWSVLCQAARDAIALDLVPQNAFEDHRNADPIIYLVEPEPGDVGIDNQWAAGAIPQMPALPRLVFYWPTLPQPYHLEVWAEKTTVNDVLLPLAERYHFNLITGIGELSATHCRRFVNRAAASGRPVRILYISDFDLLNVAAAAVEQPIGVLVGIEERSLDAIDVGLIFLERFRDRLPWRFGAIGPCSYFGDDVLPFGGQCINLGTVAIACVACDLGASCVDVFTGFRHLGVVIRVPVPTHLGEHDLAKQAGMQHFEGVELGRAFAEPFLEARGTALGFLDRRPGQRVFDALVVCEHDRAELHV